MLELSSRSPQGTLFAENEQLRQANKQLQEEVNSLRRGMRGLHELIQLTNQATAETNEFTMLDIIVSAALNAIEASDGSILLIDQDTGELVFAMVSGSIRERLIGHRLPAGTGIAGWVASRREAVMVPNVNLDPRFSQSIDRRFEFKTNSIVCVPLIYRDRTLGVIQGVNKMNSKAFNQADLVTLKVVAHVAAWAIHELEKKFGEID